jgi:hypothetical protein
LTVMIIFMFRILPSLLHRFPASLMSMLAGIRKAPGGILADHRSFAPLRQWDALFLLR